MKFPTYVYKDGVFNTPAPRLINNVKECLLALEEGYWSHRHKKEDIPGLFKAEIKEAEIVEKKQSVFERFAKKPELTPQEKAAITRKKNKESKDASK